MLNIKYSYLYDSKYGLFESTIEKVVSLMHFKLLNQTPPFKTTKAIVFYCGNKPIKIIWNK
jgi:hypothetical protein